MNGEVQRVLAFLTTFIQHGANVKTLITIEDEVLSVWDVVDQTIAEEFPSETQHLVDDLMRRGAQSYVGRPRHRKLFISRSKQSTSMYLPWLHHLRE